MHNNYVDCVPTIIRRSLLFGKRERGSLKYQQSEKETEEEEGALLWFSVQLLYFQASLLICIQSLPRVSLPDFFPCLPYTYPSLSLSFCLCILVVHAVAYKFDSTAVLLLLLLPQVGAEQSRTICPSIHPTAIDTAAQCNAAVCCRWYCCNTTST